MGVREGQLPSGARRRGRQKRVVSAKEGATNITNMTFSRGHQRAPETLALPLIGPNLYNSTEASRLKDPPLAMLQRSTCMVLGVYGPHHPQIEP
jgi:hypothetical protein